MNINESIGFLKRYLVVTVATIVLVLLVMIIGATNNFTAILTILVLLTIVFFLLYYLIVGFTNLFKHIFKREGEFDWYYVLGFALSLIVFVLFFYFYISMIGASILQLL